MLPFALRFALLLCAWIVFAGAAKSELVIGMLAAALAAWASLVLLPGSIAPLRIVPLARLVIRLASGTVLAGIDVARRTLRREPDLDPGFVSVPLSLPPGSARNAFLLTQSLQPGTLPAGTSGGILQIHCLDTRQPVDATYANDERLFREVIGP